MRTRAAALTILLALPAVLSAQRIPLPRIGRRPTPPPAPLPPEAPEVARALALQRSRWSAEGYAMITAMRVPTGDGPIESPTSYGVGTHAGYRHTDHVSTTLDFTVSALNGPSLAGTAEIGSRFMPLPLDAEVRPYFDVRAAYMYLQDQYLQPMFGPGDQVGAPAYLEQSRYSRGLGAVIGTGFEYTLTNSMALTTGISAVRARMNTYRQSVGSIPSDTRFWATSFRYTLGFKYNRARHLGSVAQKK